MELKRVDHVGIAVKNLDESVQFYESLGFKATGYEVVAEQKVKVAFLPCGDSELELLESTEPDGPIARFIEKNGPGIQHIAIRVDDIDKALSSTRPPATARATRASRSSIPRPPAACCWSSPSGCNEVKA